MFARNIFTDCSNLVVGKGGRSVHILTNHFSLSGKTDWHLIQYRVDFKPEEDQTFIRRMLLRDVSEQLPKYIFDGTVLWTTRRIPSDKMLLTTVRKSDDTPMQIIIKEVGEVLPTDHHYMHFFNNVLRQCLGKLNLQLLGRNYYDPKAAKVLKDFKLELWPGYVTSIRQHENNILLCCEVSFLFFQDEYL